jgi:flavin-dependent dehydrogenase
MADSRYDVIVVGARCAGSPTAMLLARLPQGDFFRAK